MLLYPAIDLRRGRCVRLEQGSAGEPANQTDPFRIAERLARAGAEWIHIVDLDAAFGEGSNRALVAELARALPVRVQLGGGLRSEADLEEVLDGPVERAVVGTAAVERPGLASWAVARWGADRVAVGLDARGRKPVAHRPGDDLGQSDVADLARSFAEQGVRTLIYTDIGRDGKLMGPNLDLAAELAESSGAEVVISGAVGDASDLEALAAAAHDRPGIVGAIVGRAMYENRFDLVRALRVARP